MGSFNGHHNVTETSIDVNTIQSTVPKLYIEVDTNQASKANLKSMGE